MSTAPFWKNKNVQEKKARGDNKRQYDPLEQRHERHFSFSHTPRGRAQPRKEKMRPMKSQPLLGFIDSVSVCTGRCLFSKYKNRTFYRSSHYLSACIATKWNNLPCSIPDWLIVNLEKQGFQHSNVVQQKAIPVIFSGKDIVLVAPTGSGKTLAFLIPLLSLVDFKKSWIQALILVPTAELGFQIYRLARSLCSSLPLSSTYYQPRSSEHSVVGFLSKEERNIRSRKEKQPVIMISTLDGALECLSNSCLERVKHIVLDEFDDYFIRSSWRSKILGLFPSSHSRQLIFSSATLQQSQHFLYQCRQQKWTRQDELEYIQIDKTEWIPKVVHYYYLLKEEEENRIQVLINIWRQQKLPKAIVFIREDSKLTHIAQLLQEEWQRQTSTTEENLLLVCLSTNASLKSRQHVIRMFCDGDANLLLISGQLMRGLDIPQVTQVYNLEWTDGVEEYVHRAGRSARWLRYCCAVVFFMQYYISFVIREGLVLSFVRHKELFALERVSNQLNIRFVQWPFS